MSIRHFEPQNYLEQLIPLLLEIEAAAQLTPKQLARLVKKYPRADGRVFAKDQLIKAYREFAGSYGLQPLDHAVIKKIKMKPVRTISGVTPVTVLTKPFPCPGKCIFCPNDIRMPKSYLSDEPGAQRAERNFFDPYLQTYNRLQALHNIGHTVDKVEIIVLGGTWSYYPESYQIWFIKECFRALNEFGIDDDRSQITQRYATARQQLLDMEAHAPSNKPEYNKQQLEPQQIKGETLTSSYNQIISQTYVAPEKKAGLDNYQQASWDELFSEHQKNEIGAIKCVGLVVETRPDNISVAELKRIRKLGCTKTQIGFQSLQDTVLAMNHRGHDVAATRRAVTLLRQAGFKIHAHWMANLYGSSVDADIADFEQMFSDPEFMPDELKLYPCSLIESAELMQYYQKGLWQPYDHDQLLEVVSTAIATTPQYCRLTRVIRDIPSTDIVSGNKLTNFRQIAEAELERKGIQSRDIRAREVKNYPVDYQATKLSEIVYTTTVSEERFIQIEAPLLSDPDQKKLVAFLRLSLPDKSITPLFDELRGCAMIREVHVYGQMVPVGEDSGQRTQHKGFGKHLISYAAELSATLGYTRLAVISAVGTREYYRKLGFRDGELYQFLDVSDK